MTIPLPGSLPLSTEDIKRIVDIYDDCLKLTFEEGKPAYESEGFYEEVLERFNKEKHPVHQPLSEEEIDKAAITKSMDYVDGIQDGGTREHPWNDHDVERGYQVGFKDGILYERERLMKEAVEGQVTAIDTARFLDIDQDICDKRLAECKDGDKVKLIILK